MKKIIFLGDSITDADHCFSENSLGNGYVDMVDKTLNYSAGRGKKYDILNCGHDGFTIQGVKRMLEHDCISREPDIVSLLIGCNDVGIMMNTGKSLEEQGFEACYESVIRELSERTSARVICMAPFIFPYPRKYINWIPGIRRAEEIEKKIAERHHVEFLKLQDLMISAAEKAGYENITTDGIHLTEGGNEIIAGELMRLFD